LIVLVAVAALVGSVVSPASGAFGFGLLTFVIGGTAVAVAEAWQADIWKRSGPPTRIDLGHVPDYLVWFVRHRTGRN
jgi:hypothetical protein